MDAPRPATAPFDADQAKKHQEEWAAYLRVPVEYTNSIGMKFRLVPPGEFLMGSSEQEIARNLELTDSGDTHTVNCINSERPQHRVRLTKAFYIGVHEVTQQQYLTVTGTNPSYFSNSGEGQNSVENLETFSFPVEMVNYDDATAFLRRLSEMEAGGQDIAASEAAYQLPSEAEWEFAALGGRVI